MKYSYFICEQFSALVQQVKITQTFNITFFSFFFDECNQYKELLGVIHLFSNSLTSQ